MILTIGLSECEFSGSYLNGYAEGQKIGFSSFSKAKENCFQGTLIFIKINQPMVHRLKITTSF